ncbi:MAG: sodium:solute symporter, partial [Deltaproteobacteria bacterium]|nr:sodium:solute symporter [Deltaproteobacteria bacterium]
LFFARRLWGMKLLTLSDFFRDRFGPRAETLSAIVMIPGYFGWIAVQFLAVAGILELFFGLPVVYGVLIVAVAGTGYTLLGGMWAVTVTDAVQLVILLFGLVALGVAVLLSMGQPSVLLAQVGSRADPGYLAAIPTESARELLGWMSLLAIGVLGNLPGQDLTQRIFSTKSAKVAQQACIAAGITYIVFGAIPVFLGLVAGTALPVPDGQSVIVYLASTLLSPTMALIVVVALTSAVMSTIDSAILAPASVMAQNLLARARPDADRLRLNRFAVLFVALASLAVAYVGESAFSLLEAAYEIGLMGLFVPLAMGLYREPRSETPALATMGLGAFAWLVHLVLGWEHFLGPLGSAIGFEVPASLPVLVIEVVLYAALDRPRRSVAV